MPMQRDLSPFVIAELAARESWKRRDYAAAYAGAGHAAELAQEAGDEVRWWKMVLLQAECLRNQGSIQECQELAADLAAHPVAASSPDLGARAATLLAHSLQGLGRLPEAVEAASTAARLVAGDSENVYLHIQAQQALIAALAESGRHEDAWQECLDLESLLSDHVDEDTAGKAYWVIGNVAFLSNRVNEGGHYHDLAAGKLSPSQDVDLWARFNRASAEMRLQAKLGDAATLRCIERAELATEVVGGSERDILEMSLVRAHWYYLTGDMETAISLLTPLRSKFPILATQTAAEATFVLGRALMAQGHEAESLQMLDEAATLFDTAAAPERSATVRGFIASTESSDRRQQQFLQGG
ncbi:tol-pal system YbgF family protein [Arthrobacter sp. NPDC057013]|uniref:tetratricopeptide repeat protein n=1 Tax=Arthrobacter sp. NPDC057013 TaxID=3345999 RepID=UPI00363550D8